MVRNELVFFPNFYEHLKCFDNFVVSIIKYCELIIYYRQKNNKTDVTMRYEKEVMSKLINKYTMVWFIIKLALKEEKKTM